MPQSQNFTNQPSVKSTFGLDLSNSHHSRSSDYQFRQKKEQVPIFISKSENALPTFKIGETFSNDNYTDIDADDEKDTNSSIQNTESTDVKLTNDVSRVHFEKITNNLLKQLNLSKEESNKNKNLVNALTEKLNNLNKSIHDKNVQQSSIMDENTQNIINFYNQKINDINEVNKDKFKKFEELEETFNNIQRLQSEYYQSHLKQLQNSINLNRSELDELKVNYHQLELWVLALFKEIGSDKNFQIRYKDVIKAMKPPAKKSNLENIYRYLVQYLYEEKDS